MMARRYEALFPVLEEPGGSLRWQTAFSPESTARDFPPFSRQVGISYWHHAPASAMLSSERGGTFL